MRPHHKTGGGAFTDWARRAQIVGCAIEVVAERGYAQASVGRIAERAGVATSLVLRHFANADELVAAVVAEIHLAAVAVVAPRVDAEPTAAGKLRAYIHANATFIDTHRTHALALLDIWTSYRSAAGLRLDEMAACAEPGDEAATLDPGPILRLGQRSGEFRAFSPEAMAVALRQAIDGAVLQLSRDPGFDVRGYAAELAALFDLATRPQP